MLMDLATILSDRGALVPSDFHDVETGRRAAPRTACDRVVEVMTAIDDPRVRKMRVVDCSVGGVGILSDQPMRADDVFLLKLKLDRVCLLVYTVRHCRPTASDLFRIGAVFTGFVAGGHGNADPSAVLEALLADAA